VVLPGHPLSVFRGFFEIFLKLQGIKEAVNGVNHLFSMNFCFTVSNIWSDLQDQKDTKIILNSKNSWFHFCRAAFGGQSFHAA
jgi:hypothetical protein